MIYSDIFPWLGTGPRVLLMVSRYIGKQSATELYSPSPRAVVFNLLSAVTL